MKSSRGFGASFLIFCLLCEMVSVDSAGSYHQRPAFRNSQFLDASNNTCDQVWSTWPSIHQQATVDGTYIIFEVFASVGNLFVVLKDMLKVVRFLEVSLVLDWRKGFPGFRHAFDPSEIIWDVDPAPLKKRARIIEEGGNSGGFHALTCMNGVIVLSDTQLTRLVSVLEMNASSLAEVISVISEKYERPKLKHILRTTSSSLSQHDFVDVQPCAWNLLLKRSDLLLKSLQRNNPWASGVELKSEQRPVKYVGWHVRTPNGESNTSYSPEIHQYIIQEPANVVCPAFEAATDAAKSTNPELFPKKMEIFVSSNSKQMARSCIEDLAKKGIQGSQVDMGLGPEDAHTEFSRHPLASINAFLDYMFLLDAAVLVRTGSSFSGTIARMKQFVCSSSSGHELSDHVLYVCFPNYLSG